MTDRDRLIELLQNCVEENVGVNDPNVSFEVDYENIADYLLANGVRVIDTKVINPENRELITHFAGMPINDVLDLVRAEKEGRLIRPPCKVGDKVYAKYSGTNKIEYYVIDEVTHLGSDYFQFEAHLENEDGYTVDTIEFGVPEIGLTVFLTKEEAEKALMERKDNNG